MMNAIIILCVQSIRCNKICGITADLFCLPVHHIREPLHTARNMFCNSDCRIIVRLQHQRVQKILQAEFLPAFHPQLYLRLRYSLLTYIYSFGQIPLFQRKDTSHDLRRACHRHLIPAVFCK